MGETPKIGRTIGFVVIGLLVIVGGIVSCQRDLPRATDIYYRRQPNCGSGRSYPALWLAEPLENTFGLWFRCTYSGRHRHVLCDKRELGHPLRRSSSGISGDGWFPKFVVIGVLPQLLFWVTFTMIIGALAGAIAVAIARKRNPAFSLLVTLGQALPVRGRSIFARPNGAMAPNLRLHDGSIFS